MRCRFYAGTQQPGDCFFVSKRVPRNGLDHSEQIFGYRMRVFHPECSLYVSSVCKVFVLYNNQIWHSKLRSDICFGVQLERAKKQHSALFFGFSVFCEFYSYLRIISLQRSRNSGQQCRSLIICSHLTNTTFRNALVVIIIFSTTGHRRIVVIRRMQVIFRSEGVDC